MANEGQKDSEIANQIFKDELAVLARADTILANFNLDQRQMLVEYKNLRDGFEQLLRTSIRISKAGDRAQRKLLKFKELMDTFRDSE